MFKNFFIFTLIVSAMPGHAQVDCEAPTNNSVTEVKKETANLKKASMIDWKQQIIAGLCKTATIKKSSGYECIQKYTLDTNFSQTPYWLAYSICSEGTAGAGSRGVACFKYANEFFQVQDRINLSACKGSYPQVFECSRQKFHQVVTRQYAQKQ